METDAVHQISPVLMDLSSIIGASDQVKPVLKAVPSVADSWLLALGYAIPVYYNLIRSGKASIASYQVRMPWAAPRDCRHER